MQDHPIGVKHPNHILCIEANKLGHAAKLKQCMQHILLYSF
jgi:hypothetical protein